MEILIHQHKFILHHYGSMFWVEKKILFVADLHLGKIEHFRSHGSPLPDLSNAIDYIHLEQNISQFKPKQIIILGDLFHSTLNRSWNIFKNWLSRQPLQFTLIVGNHDIIPLDNFQKLGINVQYKMEISDFICTHIPEHTKDKFNICGHVHPGYKLRGKAKQTLSLSCFYKKQNQIILPAFGSFTGNYYVKPDKGEQIFVLSEDSVIQAV